MGNKFDSSNYPTTEPSEIIEGDRLAWKRSDLHSDYANDAYTLTYQAVLETGTTTISITATASGTDYLVEVASATTAAYTVGVYQWFAFITRDSDSERITIDSGTWEVKPNNAADTSDRRTHVKTVLDAIEATIEGRASQDQMSYTIAGRSLSRMTIDDLLRFRDHYRAEYTKEIRKERRANKQGTGALIKVRF